MNRQAKTLRTQTQRGLAIGHYNTKSGDTWELGNAKNREPGHITLQDVDSREAWLRPNSKQGPSVSELADTPAAPPDEVRLFLCRPDSVEDPGLFERYSALLDAEERERLSRYRFERDRRRFVISHALVRAALSEFADISPAAWRFRKNRSGRPEIENPLSLPLRFSLSHTRDLIACAVSRALEVGIDVEAVEDSNDVAALAERAFAPKELLVLNALPSGQRIDQFYAIWTLKEAYAKARGLGLSLPLDQAAFQINDRVIEMDFEGKLADQRSLWSFALLRPTSEHWLAVAAQITGAAALGINPQWLLPLSSPSPADTCAIVAASRQ